MFITVVTIISILILAATYLLVALTLPASAGDYQTDKTKRQQCDCPGGTNGLRVNASLDTVNPQV